MRSRWEVLITSTCFIRDHIYVVARLCFPLPSPYSAQELFLAAMCVIDSQLLCRAVTFVISSVMMTMGATSHRGSMVVMGVVVVDGGPCPSAALLPPVSASREGNIAVRLAFCWVYTKHIPFASTAFLRLLEIDVHDSRVIHILWYMWPWILAQRHIDCFATGTEINGISSDKMALLASFFTRSDCAPALPVDFTAADVNSETYETAASVRTLCFF